MRGTRALAKNTMRRLAGFGLAALPVLFAFVYACADDPPAPGGAPSEAGVDVVADDAGTSGTMPVWKSGTRLRADVEHAAEASRFVGFFDTMRNEQCMFRSTTEGVRCLPYGADIIYDDALCEVPALISRSTCPGEPPIAYSVRYRPTQDLCSFSGNDVDEVRAVGAPTAARDGFSRLSDGRCVPRPAGTGEYVTLGAVVPLTAFMSATVVRENASDAIARGRWKGEDGSELIDGLLYDRARNGAPCNPATVGGERPGKRPWVCVTGRQGAAQDSVPVFSDPACMTRAGESSGRVECPLPDVILRGERVDAGQCMPGFATTLHAAGPEATTLFDKPGGGACTPRTAMPDERWVSLGPRIDPATLPALGPTLFGNSGRGRLRAWSNGGVALEYGSFWDDAEKSPCSVAPFADGKLYCVPDTTLVRGNFYKDASCLQPIVLGNDCDAAPTFVIDASPTFSCAAYPATGYGVGATKLPPGSQYWTKIDDVTCTGPMPISFPQNAFDILAPTPVSTRLLEVTRVRE
jgi:hypothetical protein